MFLKVKGGGGGSSIVPFKVGGALVGSVHVARAVSECTSASRCCSSPSVTEEQKCQANKQTKRRSRAV